MAEPQNMTITLKNGVKIYTVFGHRMYADMVRTYERKSPGDKMVINLFQDDPPRTATIEFPVELLESVATTRMETTTFGKNGYETKGTEGI